jgi:hypothetical protein
MMFVLGTIFGLIIGAGAMLLLALYLGQRKQETQQDNTLAYGGVSFGHFNNHQTPAAPTVTMKSFNERLLADVMKHYEGKA